MDREPVLTKRNSHAYIQYQIHGKTVTYDLYHANKDDRSIFTPKPNTELFRVNSNKPFYPIVCIDIDKNLVYFLESYSEDDCKKWENKGIKIQFSKTLREIIR
jgi:hypothetical protein